MAESLDPTKPRSCILGFFEAFKAVANALILSSALYLSKISRMFKTEANVRKRFGESVGSKDFGNKDRGNKDLWSKE